MPLVAPDELTRYWVHGNSSIHIGLRKNVQLQVTNVLQDFDSDHHPVIFEIAGKNISPENNKRLTDYDKAGWTAFRNYNTNNMTEHQRTVNVINRQ